MQHVALLHCLVMWRHLHTCSHLTNTRPSMEHAPAHPSTDTTFFRQHLTWSFPFLPRRRFLTRQRSRSTRTRWVPCNGAGVMLTAEWCCRDANCRSSNHADAHMCGKCGYCKCKFDLGVGAHIRFDRCAAGHSQHCLRKNEQIQLQNAPWRGMHAPRLWTHTFTLHTMTPKPMLLQT